MPTKIITGSVTYAIACKEALLKNGFKAAVKRKAGDVTLGCGYFCLTDAPPEKAEEILKAGNIKYSKIS